MTADASGAGEFLASFFAPPNGIALANIAGGGKSAHLLPWVDRLRLTSPPLPTVLPSRRDGRVYWYGLAFSDAQLSALGDNLLAFVGPTYSTFRGASAILDPSDPIDASVLRLTTGFAFKFSGLRGADKSKPIWDALELMRVVWARRPDRILDAPRAPGRVLRDFYMALRAGNAGSADAALRYLSDQRQLTPDNILFLRVQALADLGDWDGLLARPELPDLLQMRRPLVVTEALLRAVYYRELAPFERASDIDGAIAHFRAVVAPSNGTLFVRRAGMRAPEALKALMLLAVAGDPPDPVLSDSIWRVRGISEDDRLYLKQLADRLPTRVAHAVDVPLLQRAADARDRGDYEGAFALASAEPGSPARARLLVECAYELQTLEAQREALIAVNALSQDERTTLLRARRIQDMYESLRVDTRTTLGAGPPEPGRVPGDWIEWLQFLERDDAWEGALSVARRGAREWQIEDLLSGTGRTARMTALLGSLVGNAIIQDVLPLMIAFFERDVLWPRPELRSVYATVLDLLAAGSNGNDDDVRVYVRLMEGVIELGVDKKEYAQLLSELKHLLLDTSSLGRVVWGLEALEATVALPCPDEGARVELLIAVAGLVRKYWRKVDLGQRTALCLLAQDLGQPDLYDSLAPVASPAGELGVAAPDVLARLNGKTIAIYTLTERAGRYMQKILAERAPDAKVQLAHDLVGSERLKQLARRADLFIVAAASAKHAATEFIEAIRHPGLPLLKPSGKGMTSMLQALEQFLADGLT